MAQQDEDDVPVRLRRDQIQVTIAIAIADRERRHIAGATECADVHESTIAMAAENVHAATAAEFDCAARSSFPSSSKSPAARAAGEPILMTGEWNSGPEACAEAPAASSVPARHAVHVHACDACDGYDACDACDGRRGARCG